MQPKWATYPETRSEGDDGRGRIWSVARIKLLPLCQLGFSLVFSDPLHLRPSRSASTQKQKKRAKAASDPSCPPNTTTTILQIDHMSSEYSSEGEPDDSYAKMAPGMWDLVSGGSMMAGREVKCLEIRTPRWRSHEVS